jgi:Ca2+-binding RTX toxin-like protein
VTLLEVATTSVTPPAGTGAGDTINGDDGADQLFGQAGDDTVNGGADDDYAEGNVGADDQRNPAAMTSWAAAGE